MRRMHQYIDDCQKHHCGSLFVHIGLYFWSNYLFAFALSIVQSSSFISAVCAISVLILTWIENRGFYLFRLWCLMVAACSYFCSSIESFEITVFPSCHFHDHFFIYILMHSGLLFTFDWLEIFFERNKKQAIHQPA